jgi:MFS superfamily sulfate permease-like transporter
MKSIRRIITAILIILCAFSIMLENFWMGILVGFILAFGFFFADILNDNK